MGARTGKEYIAEIKERKTEVWIHGEKVDDVTTHPAFKNVVESVAGLYDLNTRSQTKCYILRQRLEKKLDCLLLPLKRKKICSRDVKCIRSGRLFPVE